MIPDRCSVRESQKQCVNPPAFVISIITKDGEYMVGVTCEKHKEVVSEKVKILQNEDKIPSGTINFEELKAVGTDCINAKPEDFIQID